MTNYRPIKSHRDLTVWHLGMQVRREVRGILLSLPRQDRFEIGGQVARAALSIPANIAEGHGRLERRDYKQLLSFSRGSVGELDTHLIGIAKTIQRWKRGFAPRSLRWTRFREW
jgi:four helix bundle protein